MQLVSDRYSIILYLWHIIFPVFVLTSYIIILFYICFFSYV